MLTLFFTIIFLAEIIVAGWVISWIVKLDKKVCETNKKMLEFQPKMREQIKKLTCTLELASSCLDYFVTFIAERKTTCVNSLKKNIITTILFMILKIPFKQIATGVEILLLIKKILRV